MIDKALKTLGKQRCGNCKKVQSKENAYCRDCGNLLNLESGLTSTPEDGLK